MYCRKCGAEIKETSKFCDSCGCEVVKVKQVSYAEKYNENKRNIAFLSKALVSVAQSRNIQSKTAVLCHIMDTGNVFDTAKSKESVSKNKFNNFTQRDYDFGDIEKKLAEKNKKQ